MTYVGAIWRLRRSRTSIDDILVHGRTNSKHNQWLKKTLEWIKQSGTKLNKEKCEFNESRIEYFEQMYRVQLKKERIRSIMKLSNPTCVSELRRIIGMIQYYGQFRSNIADIQPMLNLLKKKTEYHWIRMNHREKHFQR